MKNKKSKAKDSIFPYKVYPKVIRKIVQETNKNLLFPIDFISSSILYAASVAIGNTHKIEVKKGWVESAVLYIAIVGKAGVNKSHPLSFAIKPIEERNAQSFKQYNKKLKEYLEVKSKSDKERKAEGLKIPNEPILKKQIVSDITPEALVQVLSNNDRGIGVYMDELATWFKNFNRYNSGSEMEFWLSAWSSKSISIDRKTSAPLLISTPFLSVCGTIQNKLLDELGKDNRMHNGFIERILFVMPDDIQKEYWVDSEIDLKQIENWNSIIDKILNLKLQRGIDNTISSKIIKLSKGAKKNIYKWQKKNADDCNKKENESVSGIYSKMEIYVMRIALILQILDWSCNESSTEEISKKTIKNAITLIEYFKNQSIKVSKKIRIKTPKDLLSEQKKSLYENLPKEFKTKEGIELSIKHEVTKRTFNNFLKNEELFDKIKHGHYKKNY